MEAKAFSSRSFSSLVRTATRSERSFKPGTCEQSRSSRPCRRSADTTRVGRLEYIATMSRPRLAAPPPGYQVGGGVGNRMAFYVYQVDVTGTVNGDPVTRQADPGGAAAVKQVRADVRFGPITINQ